MTQKSFFKREFGGKRTISLARLDPLHLVQYSPEHVKLRTLLKIAGFLNNISVLNNSDYDVELQLDYSENKTYYIPAKSTITLPEVHFEGFNIVNLDAGDTIVVDTVIISVGYEAPVAKEQNGGRR